jgi:hypothetical protein
MDGKDAIHHRRSPGSQDLDGVTGEKTVTADKAVSALIAWGEDVAHKKGFGAFASHILRVGFHALGIPKVKTCAVPSVVQAVQAGIPGRIFLVFLRIFKIKIQGLPVDANGNGKVVDALHAAFDFKGADPCGSEFRNMADHAKIPGIEDVAPTGVFREGHIVAWPLGFKHGVAPSAGMGAKAPVAVPVGHIAAEKAAA